MTEETTQQNNGASTTTTQTAAGSNGGQQQTTDAKTFSQADIDRIIQERLARANDAATTKLLESLGVKTLDEAKTTLEAKRKADEESLTEIEKQKKAAEKANADREKLEAELKQERESRRQEKLDQAIRAAAKGAHDPDEIVLFLRKDAGEALAKALKDDGTIDAKAIEPLIADLKKKKAYLFGGQTPGSPSNHGGRAPEPDADAKKEARAALARQMRRTF